MFSFSSIYSSALSSFVESLNIHQAFSLDLKNYDINFLLSLRSIKEGYYSPFL